MYESVPEELKQMNNWVCWSAEDRGGGKLTKRPINPRTGEYAKSNDSSTWSDYETALNASEHFNGIGFMLSDGIFGIDIDDVENEIKQYIQNDETDNIVAEFIEMMESYAEISPSGKGIHILAKGELPKGGSRKGNVEMYSEKRFLTVTGNRIGRFSKITEDELGKINYLHNKYIASNEPVKQNLTDSEGNGLSENDIIRIASNSKNGTRFKLFLKGGWEQFYDSWSEADMAFANDLAFWTNRDISKMDSIFRRSSLYREKWDSKRGDETYGYATLNKAISECTNVFNPQQHDDDFNLYVLDSDSKPVDKKYYSYDDTGNAERFTDNYGDIVRYSYIRKNWYYYNGKYWQIDQEGKVKGLVDEILEKMKQEPIYTSDDMDEEDAQKALRKHIKYSRGSNGKTNMLKESQHLLPIQPDDFDKDKHLLNVQNGYLDLHTGQLHEHDRNKFFTKIASVEYTDKIDCPQWIDFLYQIFDGNTALINYIQRAVGYSLSGSTEEQMMFILHGNGRNGKSVFLDIITDMLGNYTTNIQPQTIMVKQQQGAANSDIAKLDGARLVTSTEPNDGMRFDEGLVKQITGGDKITARFLYGEEFDYYPQLKLWMATNHKPIIRGTDDGIWRRMAIIPFTVQIPENKVDKQLKNKLKREMKGILNWAVEGYQEWKRIGLNEPNVVKQQRNDYRTEMDVLETFIDECCIRRDGEREKSSDLYNVYKSWAKDNEQYLMSSTKFGKEMNNKFQKIKSNGVHYAGIKLKRSFNDEPIRLNMS